MDIAVTGGSGFIGQRVCKAFYEAGHEVLSLDFFEPKEEVPWKYHHVNLLDGGPYMNIAAILADNAIDKVFHLAAEADVNNFAEAPIMSVRKNVEMTARVLQASKEAPTVKTFFLASTVWIYQGIHPADVQILKYKDKPEKRNTVRSERAGFLPENFQHPYAATKLAAEALCGAYNGEDLQTCCMRYGIPYGPGMRENLVIAIFYNRIREGKPITFFGDGSASRNFIYVDDLACAHVRLAALNNLPPVLNIDGEKQISLLEIVRALENLTGLTAFIEYKPERPGDMPPLGIDSQVAWESMRWRPQTPFHVGLQRTIEYLDSLK